MVRPIWALGGVSTLARMVWGNFFGKKFLDFGGLTPCQIGLDSSHNYNDASLKPVNTITHRGLFRGGAAVGGGGRNLGVGLKKNQNSSSKVPFQKVVAFLSSFHKLPKYLFDSAFS